MFNKVNRNTLVLIIFLVLTSSFLRFFRINQTFVFGADEQYQTTYAMSLVKDFHPIWIGVNAAHTGFYLGPIWTYFTAFLLFLSSGNPLVTGYVAALIGVVTTLVIFFVAKDIFNTKTAFLSSLLYACLPMMVYYDQKYWNPSLVPLLSITLLYSFLKIRDNPKWIVVAAFGFGLIFHTHLSLVPIGIIGLFVVGKNFEKIGIKLFTIAVLIFLLVYSPLVIFDINHSWSNIKTPFRLGEISDFDTSSQPNPTFHLKSLSDSLGRVWYLKPNVSSADEVLHACSQLAKEGTNISSDRTYASIISILISITSVLLFIFNKHIKLNVRLLFLGFVGLITGSFIFFPGGAFEYYLLGIFPLMPIMFSANIGYTNVFLRYSIYVLAGVMVVLGFYTIINNTALFGLQGKKLLVDSVSEFIGDKRFELFESGGCHAYEGWRYLFQSYGETPDRSSAIDSNLGWLYPDEIYRGDLDYKVIMHEQRIRFQSTEETVKKLDSQGFSVYIYKW